MLWTFSSRDQKNKNMWSVYKDAMGNHLSMLSDIYWFDYTVRPVTVLLLLFIWQKLNPSSSNFVFPGNWTHGFCTTNTMHHKLSYMKLVSMAFSSVL